MALTPIYVALASVYVGYHHLPHFLDAFYGAVVCAPIAVLAGAIALPTWTAIAMYFISILEFYAFAVLMSPPVPILNVIGEFLPDALINAVPTALLFFAGRIARTKLFPSG
jgi:hypothetical protein